MDQKFISCQPRKLRERLILRVLAEKGHMKEYLFELANEKVKDCQKDCIEIKAIL
jgi:hypothetical protein